MAKTAGEETSRTKLFELLIENPGEVVSSSRVTERLSASRQAVFKAACALRDEGAAGRIAAAEGLPPRRHGGGAGARADGRGIFSSREPAFRQIPIFPRGRTQRRAS